MKKILYLLLVLLLSHCAGRGVMSDRFINDDEVLSEANYLYENEKYDQAAEIFNFLFLNYDFSAYKSYSLYMIGMSHMKSENWLEASEAFEMFVNRFMTDSLYPNSLYNLAFCYENSAPQYERDQTDRKLALMYYIDFIARFPGNENVLLASERIDECENVLMRKLLHEAYIYRKMGKIDASLVILKTAIGMYPSTDYIPKAFMEISDMSLLQHDTTEAEKYLLKIIETENEYTESAREKLLLLTR